MLKLGLAMPAIPPPIIVRFLSCYEPRLVSYEFGKPLICYSKLPSSSALLLLSKSVGVTNLTGIDDCAVNDLLKEMSSSLLSSMITKF